jgi:hypothetical protein
MATPDNPPAPSRGLPVEPDMHEKRRKIINEQLQRLQALKAKVE